jgi:hypothetical protein
MNDPWNRLSWQSSPNLFANDEPSDMSPGSSGGILGNFGQSTERRPASQFLPDAPWNAPWAPTASTWAQWPTRPSIETYDPEALNFAAAWRRMYSTPRPPVFGPAIDLTRSYGQPSNNAEKPEFLSPVEHGNWPAEVNGPYNSAPTLAVVPASYQTGARPWWAPVAPPDVFDPWREHALKGLLGLYKFFSDSGSYPSGGNRNGPGCKEEWEAAREQCAEWLSSPNPPRRLTGGYSNVEDCARGHVSERCGGNPIDR